MSRNANLYDIFSPQTQLHPLAVHLLEESAKGTPSKNALSWPDCDPAIESPPENSADWKSTIDESQIAAMLVSSWKESRKEAREIEEAFSKGIEGDPPALCNLASRLWSGRGVPQNRAAARTLYLEAAGAGDWQAIKALASGSITGTDRAEHNIERYRWLLCLIKGRRWNRRSRFGYMASRMTKEQVAEAIKRHNKWIKLHKR